jgi:hypothetical protein
VNGTQICAISIVRNPDKLTAIPLSCAGELQRLRNLYIPDLRAER